MGGWGAIGDPVNNYISVALLMLQASLPVTTYCWTENKLAEISSSLRQSELIQKDYSQSKIQKDYSKSKQIKIIKSTDSTENG